MKTFFLDCYEFQTTFGVKTDVLRLIYKRVIVPLISYASRPWGHSLSKKINKRLIRRTQRRFLLRVIKGYKTISYEAVFAISGIPPIDLVILNKIDGRENYLSTSLDTLDGRIPVSLLPHSSCRKSITLVTYANEIIQEYKTVCFTDGTELLCINLVVKLIQESLHQGGTLNFLICTDSLSSLHCSFSVNSTEKLVAEIQCILNYLDCGIPLSYYRGHSGNLGNDRADQLAKDTTFQDMNLLMSVSLSHWKYVAWERTVSSWNTELLASPKALWTRRFFSTIYERLKCKKFVTQDMEISRAIYLDLV
ncbi:RNase H domain-containing protein [Trichonephila clavipes]|uniref:RNase H domain-containing protein n=1 Tax=Trichonephila clavipes TaxID=2585209 RepID=A0A8X6RE07_TRICX|nr:RNase H domain-containing protein [Trichonephila clavipes]